MCHSDEVMREDDANETSGELCSAFPESLLGESAFKDVMRSKKILQVIFLFILKFFKNFH